MDPGERAGDGDEVREVEFPERVHQRDRTDRTGREHVAEDERATQRYPIDHRSGKYLGYDIHAHLGEGDHTGSGNAAGGRNQPGNSNGR